MKFIIESIDPMGNGVFKKDGNVYFIPKTLPGETGKCRVVQSKKNIHFAELISLEQRSSQRRDAPCAHYNECAGCHYQHMDYETELQFKKNSLLRHLRHIEFHENHFKIHPAESRYHYRNRAQLHYERKNKFLGFKKYKSQDVLSIHQCELLSSALAKNFEHLKTNWSEQKHLKANGHIEIYDKAGEVHTAYDLPYAHGGFSQVNPEMNSVLIQLVQQSLQSFQPGSVLELFAGDGNLTQKIEAEIFRVDYYTEPKDSHNFLSTNLYAKKALSLTKSWLQKDIQTLILDPTRSGLKNLDEWSNSFKPDHILYISCDPATLARDLKGLGKTYGVVDVHLIDLFPATYHYETLVLLKRH